MPDLKILSALRQDVASLNVLSCQLAHEKVRMEDGLAKRRSQGVGLEPIFVRAGLCPKQVRSRQLSCAHTLARDVFKQAIDTSEQQGILSAEEASRLRHDLQCLSDVIHSTDWTKNTAEIRYALLREQETMNGCAASTSAQEEQQGLDALVERHQESVEELRRMHRFLLERIDNVLRSP